MLLERWERVESLFRGALKRDPAERQRWLSSAEEDPEIRSEVASLLTADEEAGDRIERLVREGVKLVSRRPFGLGVSVEGYQLVEVVGRGGSSTVYLGEWRRGERSGPEQVAVKVLRSEVRSTLARRRFLLEGEILARLDHPGIARLLSAGTTPDERPYFLMEYVEGESLLVHCQHHRPSLDRRLRLFRQVCEAVQYAHRNLVVHQDLKPVNILVAEDGRPKLLDFGIARLVDRHPRRTASDGREELTVTAARRLTPGYASPEQIRGNPLTTATDVFSLGVILYELLADRHPFRQPEQGASELEQAILEEEPRAPSSALRRSDLGEHRRRARRVRGDLDRVVALALAKERELRYGSVEQLSEDLRRFLEGRPVAARAPTRSYRAGKFLSRHWMGVAATVALLLLLAIFTTVSVLQQRRTARAWEQASEERTKAERERSKAEQALAFLVDTFEVAGPDRARGETVTAREILDHGADRILEELDDQPEVQATLLEALGRVYSQLGLYDRAQSLLEDALVLQRRAGVEGTDLARTLSTLGDVLQSIGDYEAAETVYRAALDRRQNELGDRHPEVAKSLNDLGDVLHDRGDYAGAEPLYQAALEMRRDLFGERHPAVAESLNNLALLFHERRELEKAEPLYRQALELRRELLGPDHPEVAVSQANLAALLHARGNLAEAEDLFRQAVALHERLHGPDGPQVVPALQNLAMLLKDRKALDEAEALLVRVLEIERRQFGEEHPNRATNLYHLGLVRREAGDNAAAADYFEQATELYRKTLSENHPWVSYPLLTLGELYLEEEQADRAEPLLRESVRLRRAALGDDSPLSALAESALGECLAIRSGGQISRETERLLARSLEILEQTYGPDDTRTAWARRRVERWLAG